MAKKRGGEGSNLGLIITLIFFVLTTIILGVTTYLGYSDIDAKVKEKAEAEKNKLVEQNNASYNRMIARTMLAYAGTPVAGTDATEVAREKQQFDAGQFPAAASQTNRDAVLQVFKTLDRSMPWDTSKDASPSLTYEQRIGKLSAENEAFKTRVARAEKAVKTAEQDRKDFEDSKEKEIAALRKAIEDLRAKVGTDRQLDLKTIADHRARADAEGQKRAELAKERDDLLNSERKLKTQLTDLQGKLTAANKILKDVRDTNEELQTQMTAVKEKYGIDTTVAQAAALDASARKILESWNKSWRIVELDRRGEMPFISLGSADGLTPQVTFSIHSVGPNGKLTPNPKGTLEVVRILGANQAQARITSVRDARRDPIVRGDRLFNATWDPNRKRHIAIAGIVDLGGEVGDGTRELRTLLNRQGVIVDAYIDTPDGKSPKLVGKGIALGKDGTDYLVVGESLDSAKHPKASDKEYREKYDKLIEDLKKQAATNGVAVISLRRYLDMIGYQPPKIITTGSGNGKGQ